MKGLIITISAALMMGWAQGQASPAPSAPNQPASTNDPTLIAGAAMPAGLNTSTPAAGNMTTSTTTTLNSTNTSGGQPTNGTLAALSGTVAPTTTNSSSSSTNGTTTSTAWIGSTASFNSSGSSIFVMDRDISWSHSSSFNIYDQNGTVAYQITNHYANTTLAAKEFIVQDALSGEIKLRIDAKVKWCGFGQTYEADDGAIFYLDPRAFLADRWYITDDNSEYTFKRHAMSLQGNILENERMVAQITTQSNSTSSSSSSSKKQLTITSDGTMRPWDLIALVALASIRIRKCGY